MFGHMQIITVALPVGRSPRLVPDPGERVGVMRGRRIGVVVGHDLDRVRG
jgi:hypothetical protein